MSAKQDRQGVRKASDLEQKYQFGKSFAEILGIAMDARESVDSLASSLRSEMLEQSTSFTRDVEAIRLEAEETYTKKTDMVEYEESANSKLTQTASSLKLDFEKQVKEVQEDVTTIDEKLAKHFEFTANGLVIKAGENEVKLRVDNDIIFFYKGEIDESVVDSISKKEFDEDELPENLYGWWSGDDFYTGNIVVKVNQRARFGNYAFVPRSNGSMDFLKVGG